jgi:hypothetical protein
MPFQRHDAIVKVRHDAIGRKGAGRQAAIDMAIADQAPVVRSIEAPSVIMR